MKKIHKKIAWIFGLILIICINYPIISKAALQSNGGTVATKKIDDWIVQIRQMEALGGTFGFSETINTTGLLPTSGSNGMDCHMEKNTEYGALVILSASSYGNPSKIESGQTTTGNETGVKMNINKEWVAAGAGLTAATYAKNANERYINNDYGTVSGGKYHVGDAMNIGKWHSSGASSWFLNYSGNCGLLRAYSGSVFSYYGFVGIDNRGDAHCTKTWASRAVVVVGERTIKSYKIRMKGRYYEQKK